MRGEGSREGKQGGEKAWVVGAGRDGSGPRGDSQEGSVSAGCEVRAAREGWLGAKRGLIEGLCECWVRGEGSREGKQGGERARAVGAGGVGSGPRGD